MLFDPGSLHFRMRYITLTQLPHTCREDDNGSESVLLCFFSKHSVGQQGPVEPTEQLDLVSMVWNSSR